MRLIDADALIEDLKKWKGLDKTIEAVLETINKQPTSYDPEAVVKELEEKFERTVAEILDKTGSDYTIADFNVKRYSDRICEIVRKGGVE